MPIGDHIRDLRWDRRLKQGELAHRAGIAQNTLSQIELGKTTPSVPTLEKIARGLNVDLSELLLEEPVPLDEASQETRRLEEERSLELESAERPPLGPATPSQQPTRNKALEEERRARWDAVVREARRLRKPGQTQMQRALDAWRESKDRGEPDATRRKHLDEMGALLQEAYGAYVAVGGAYMQAALSTPGGSEASVPSYLGEETQAANDFYVELFGLVRSAGLGIRTGAAAATAEHAAAEHAAAEHAQSETRTLRVVEDPKAA
jgi:transcriptional regulator with XRE-family HTH domain